MIKKIIILGHTCFIGLHLFRSFQNNHANVELLGFNSKDVDLTDYQQIQRLKEFVDLNTVIIMLSTNKKQSGARIDDFHQNILMTVNLCRLFEIVCPLRFIYFSSQAVYGEDNHNTDITEETPVNPTSYYGMAKYISEKLFWKTFESHKDSSFLLVRMPRIYGPGDNYNNYGPTMLTYNAFYDKPISIWGSGNELRDYVFVEDLIQIVQKLLFSSFQGVVNIASGNPHSFVDIIRVVETVLNKNIIVKHKSRTGNKVDHVFKINNLKRAIGQYKFTTLEDGVKQLLNYYKNQKI